MLTTLFLPFADFKTIEVPAPSTSLRLSGDALIAAAFLAVAVVVILLLLWLWNRPWSRSTLPGEIKNWILVDGSNVMHWQDNTPQLAPLLQVIETLTGLGFAPGVVFDANVGYKLFGRYMDDGDLAQLLHLPTQQVFVVPKGKQADPFLLETARDFSARIVTNDRYRDWAEVHPAVTERGFLIRGGMRGGKVWLKGVEAVPVNGAQ